MIRVVVVDDHPALRAGLRTVLDSEPGIVFAGESSGSEESVWPILRTARPDLVLLDYHLPRGDGLQLCYRIKSEALVRAVIVFSAYAGAELTMPATLAGADAVLGKGVPARELFEVIRLVNRGEKLLGSLPPGGLREASERIREQDRALISMLLDGATEPEVARTLGVEPRDVRHVVQRTLSALRLEIPGPHAG